MLNSKTLPKNPLNLPQGNISLNNGKINIAYRKQGLNSNLRSKLSLRHTPRRGYGMRGCFILRLISYSPR